MSKLLRLYPSPAVHEELHGCYLSMGLHRSASLRLYANFIQSLDGRIALANAQGQSVVPQSLANAHDWRLYQELAAQSDVMLISARYLRQLAAQCAQDLLPIAEQDCFRDLHVWRQQQGLAQYADVVVFSASLDLPIAVLESLRDRKVFIATSAQADAQKVQALRPYVSDIWHLGAQSVDGRQLKEKLQERSYRSAYMIAGSQVFASLLRAEVIDDVFLTMRHRFLGGVCFDTVLQSALTQPIQTRLQHLYFDTDVEQEQLFAHYRVLY